MPRGERILIASEEKAKSNRYPGPISSYSNSLWQFFVGNGSRRIGNGEKVCGGVREASGSTPRPKPRAMQVLGGGLENCVGESPDSSRELQMIKSRWIHQSKTFQDVGKTCGFGIGECAIAELQISKSVRMFSMTEPGPILGSFPIEPLANRGNHHILLGLQNSRFAGSLQSLKWDFWSANLKERRLPQPHREETCGASDRYDVEPTY